MAHHALLDTCIWLDVLGDPLRHIILDRLEELLRNRNFHLVVPEILIEEFGRHKADYGNRLENSVKSRLTEVLKFVETYDEDSPERKQLIELLIRFKGSIPRLKAAKEKAVRRIEDLLTHKSNHVLKTSPRVLELAAKRGCEKKAPFLSHKNCVADAVILESLFEFVSKHQKPRSCSFSFITSNTSDFSDTTDHRKPHGQLGDAFNNGRIRFSINVAEEVNWIMDNLSIPEANKIPTGLISSFSADARGAPRTCPVCGKGVLVEAGLRGGMWYQRCTSCGMMFPVEDYVD